MNLDISEFLLLPLIANRFHMATYSPIPTIRLFCFWPIKTISYT